MSFDVFLSQLSETNSILESFVDFEKVKDNVDKISIKLNQLNYLIGKDDLKRSVKDLFIENKNCFSVLNIIIAVRDNRQVISSNGNIVELDSYFNNPEKIFEFLVGTGLDKVLKNKNIKNLVDYVFGVEVGLDTNTRKNRGGKCMEKLISDIFISNLIPFKTEVSITSFKELNVLGDDIKRFDFAVEAKSKIYLIETNFYNSGGSKLNEVARAYSDLAPKINKNRNYEFVWITDGQDGCCKNKLQEAINNIPKVYNLKTLHNFIDLIKRFIND